MVVLTLVSAATSEDVVVVSYTPPSDAATARTRDLAGNAAAGFNSTEVFNDTDETAESEENGEPEETTEGETPLTVSLEVTTESHNGTDAFTFEIRFSEEFPLSYKTLRDLAFTVSGGEVLKAQRLDKPSNIRWLITGGILKKCVNDQAVYPLSEHNGLGGPREEIHLPWMMEALRRVLRQGRSGSTWRSGCEVRCRG